MKPLRAVFFLLLLFMASCASPRPVRYEPYRPGEGLRHQETGIASWYGADFDGRKTANGETYNMYAMTAAHRTLPFNTRVRVTHLGNGRQIEVRINDRGPFVPGRIIDLSKSGAAALGMLDEGTARVRIETAGQPGERPPELAGTYGIQVGAFTERGNAERLKADLEKKHPQVRILVWENNVRRFYRVRVGRFQTEADARRYFDTLRKENLTGFIVREN
jgi:rare lipoprotein A